MPATIKEGLDERPAQLSALQDYVPVDLKAVAGWMRPLRPRKLQQQDRAIQETRRTERRCLHGGEPSRGCRPGLSAGTCRRAVRNADRAPRPGARPASRRGLLLARPGRPARRPQAGLPPCRRRRSAPGPGLSHGPAVAAASPSQRSIHPCGLQVHHHVVLVELVVARAADHAFLDEVSRTFVVAGLQSRFPRACRAPSAVGSTFRIWP